MLAGVTVTVATGAGAAAVTVMSVVPDTPSLVAVMVAVPALAAVMRPLELTEATAVLLLDHVILRPLRVVPDASFVTATSCSVAPVVTLGLCGVTVTLATGGTVTVRLAEPETPSLVAVIFVWPAAVAVTYPAVDTVATPAVVLVQVIVRPVSTLPLASRRVAVACVPCPVNSVGDARDTATVATGAGGGACVGVTVTEADPEIPSLRAVIVVEPAVSVATRPEEETVATAVFVLDQLTLRPVSTLPDPSFVVA